ncbi:GATS protein-like 3 [Gryganskiella cystojenkinii]|nr:GATS protein-like 3 [Gryganskiella cystojenkinii]
MIVDILPFRLKLASIAKDDIPRCTHQLMKLVLFPAGPQHLFSYTETEREVSLILDESHIPGFPEDVLDVCNVIWRAVGIEPGESGLGAVEVISQVSKALAEINVSIMQISTYDADFTLLPECDLTRALECLSEKFTISNDPLTDSGLSSTDLQSWEESFPMSPNEITSLQDALLLESAATIRRRQSLLDQDETGETPKCSLAGDDGERGVEDDDDRDDSGIGSEATSGPSSGLTSGHESHILDATIGTLDPSSLLSSLSLNNQRKGTARKNHPFRVNFSHRLHITSLEDSLKDQLAIKLLESIFFDNRTDRFFSFTQTDSTLSIIMDDATMSLFPDNTLNTQAGDWRLIAIGDGPLGFNECGIVSAFTGPLSEREIGLFYLSTFNSDYIMVNDQDFEQAVDVLKETARQVTAASTANADEFSQAIASAGVAVSAGRRKGSIQSIDTSVSCSSAPSHGMDPSETSPVSTTNDEEDKDEVEES